MAAPLWLPQIEREICTGCGDCLLVCPTGALALQTNKAIVALPTACRYCADCELTCPAGAISLPYEIVVGPAPGAALAAGVNLPDLPD
jgi:MinD superfamily P-loop ATPase